MSRKDKYYPDYIRIYPCLKDRTDILQVLRQSDRKMKYSEVDLKQGRYIMDRARQTAVFVPGREDSYERLAEEKKLEFAAVGDVEDYICLQDEIERLHRALQKLDKQDRALIHALFFEGISEREYAKKQRQHYMTVHNRKVRILRHLKKIIEK